MVIDNNMMKKNGATKVHVDESEPTGGNYNTIFMFISDCKKIAK